jgi:D-alanyl-D-alanine-carboxypeptidase/D-alanyl-D-alanine-endopeptidase
MRGCCVNNNETSSSAFRAFYGSRFLRFSLLVLVTMLVVVAAVGVGSMSAVSAESAMIQGDFVGTLGPLSLKLHIRTAPDGSLGCTLDSESQGALGLQCADVHREGQNLSFSVPVVHGSWKGSVDSSGATLTGTWDQGTPMPLNFSKDSVSASAKPSPVDGIWLGTLPAGAQSLRIQVVVTSDSQGNEHCSMDSIDQAAFNIACTNVVYADRQLNFDIPTVHGHWAGELSADQNALTGTWNQGVPVALNLARQSKRWSPPPITTDPAMPAVKLADMQAVMSHDFEHALKSGALAPETSAGVTIGIVQHGERRVFAFGTAKPDSIFEIGSITKTFTGLILAQMVEQGLVKLDEPVRELLPVGTVAKPQGTEVSLLDLTTQDSGLPRMPDNFKSANPDNPYADYGAANLYQYISEHGLEKVGSPKFLYSNLGVGLLGQALSNRARVPYPTLLAQQVTVPLGMRDTVVTLSAAQQGRFIEGHGADHRAAHPWDLDALAGAGAIRSTANDMLTYLEAQLHPEKLPSNHSATGRTLPAALKDTHELRADALPGMQIGFGWLYITATGTYWHNGGTGGFSSFAFFNPKGDYAGVVLLNTTVSATGSYADLVGQHVEQRLTGKPAVSLGN